MVGKKHAEPNNTTKHFRQVTSAVVNLTASSLKLRTFTTNFRILIWHTKCGISDLYYKLILIFSYKVIVPKWCKHGGHFLYRQYIKISCFAKTLGFTNLFGKPKFVVAYSFKSRTFPKICEVYRVCYTILFSLLVCCFWTNLVSRGKLC